MHTQALQRTVVLDTNVVLDLLVFDDPAIRALKLSLEQSLAVWRVTLPMRSELERVLAYPRIFGRLQATGQTGDEVLARFDLLSQLQPAAPASTPRCSDGDDQMFIDLAVAHGACLLSKDDAVLRLRKRLAGLGVEVARPSGSVPCPGLVGGSGDTETIGGSARVSPSALEWSRASRQSAENRNPRPGPPA